jgi:hypothetical protein
VTSTEERGRRQEKVKGGESREKRSARRRQDRNEDDRGRDEAGR